MSKIIPDLLIDSVKEWADAITVIYEDYYSNSEDFSFKRLLTTMIDTEKEYSSNFGEKIGGIDFKSNFSTDSKFVPDLFRESGFESAKLKKTEFIREVISRYDLLIENFKTLSILSGTESGRELFTKLAADKHRQRMILQDRLELEELY